MNDSSTFEQLPLLAAVCEPDLFLGVPDLLEVGKALLDVRVVRVYLLLVVVGLGLKQRIWQF